MRYKGRMKTFKFIQSFLLALTLVGMSACGGSGGPGGPGDGGTNGTINPQNARTFSLYDSELEKNVFQLSWEVESDQNMTTKVDMCDYDGENCSPFYEIVRVKGGMTKVYDVFVLEDGPLKEERELNFSFSSSSFTENGKSKTVFTFGDPLYVGDVKAVFRIQVLSGDKVSEYKFINL